MALTGWSIQMTPKIKERKMMVSARFSKAEGEQENDTHQPLTHRVSQWAPSLQINALKLGNESLSHKV